MVEFGMRGAMIISGVILTFLGLALGVTLIGLPAGIVIGLIGIGLFIGGQVNWKL